VHFEFGKILKNNSSFCFNAESGTKTGIYYLLWICFKIQTLKYFAPILYGMLEVEHFQKAVNLHRTLRFLKSVNIEYEERFKIGTLK